MIVSHTWSDPFFLAIVDLNHQTKTRPIKRPRKDPGGGHVPCVEKSGRGHGEACVRGVFRPSREDGGLDRSPAWVGPGLWAARRDRFSAGRSDAPAWSAARSGGSGDATTSPPGGRWSWSRVVAAIACFVLWDGDMHAARGEGRRESFWICSDVELE